VCGIVGYVGTRSARVLLLRALTRLEYRGYDSSGIGLLVANGRGPEITRVRTLGPVAELERSMDGYGAAATCGIGHTRWATHGQVSIMNAHPFISCGGELALCLNGIIENYTELRAQLRHEGHRFESETDAEVVCHLLEQYYQGGLAAAAEATARRLVGHFAFVCCHRDHPQLLVGSRRDCPLVVGRVEDGTFLASSATAFRSETSQIQQVENDEIVVAGPADVAFYAGGRRRRRPVLQADWDEELSDRGAYETLMLKEIHEQPAALRATMQRLPEPLLSRPLTPRRVVLVACGTAYHAALVGRDLVEAWAGIPCQAEIASEWRYRSLLEAGRTLVVGISQSGETADTLAALRHARALGCETLAISNVAGSQITREVDTALLTSCGHEAAVAATKTFGGQVVAIANLALALAPGAQAASKRAEADAALRQLPGQFERFLAGDHPLDELAERYAEAPYFFFLGRGPGLAAALEGALKLREIAYIPCEAYPAGEMKHGPIALIGDGTPVIVIASGGESHSTLLANIEEVRARGGRVIAIGTDDDEKLQHLVDSVIYVPRSHPLLQPLLDTLPLQLLAHHIARLRGLDPDRPRNLAKTVTVE
jgi:glucosamine--fructose-6-phosphate aminotransferase (isomerizing)